MEKASVNSSGSEASDSENNFMDNAELKETKVNCFTKVEPKLKLRPFITTDEPRLSPTPMGRKKSKTCDSDSEFCIRPENAVRCQKDSLNKESDQTFMDQDHQVRNITGLQCPIPIVIKSEILEEEESQDDEDGMDHSMEDEGDRMSHGSEDFAIGGIDSLNSNKGVQLELKKCKGRLDAFGHELKLLCAELEIVTGWIDQHFGIKLINKDSLLFKHIYDFEEIEQISAALSLLTQVGKPPKGSSAMAARRRGRPGRKSTEALNTRSGKQTSSSSRPRGGRSKKTKDGTEVELNPQDFLETIYNEKDNDFQNQSRPKRATRRKINYKEEDKDVEIQPVLTAKDSEDEFDGQEDFPVEDVGDSDFINEDPEDKQPSKPKRKRNTPKKKKPEIETENPEEDGDDGEHEEEGEGGDSESQTDGNADSEAATGKKKKRVRKRYPKKPGVVWNSSLPKQCDECGKVLKGSSTLKLHKMMHSDERPHSCEVCGNKFRFRRNLKVHMMALHTGERPLQCSFCGRKFYAPKDLRIHERTHTGEKPYPCHLCPKRFNVKEHLTMHVRVHTGERPYKCTICDKAFSQANSLRIHKKIHTRDKEPTPRKPRKPKNPQQAILTNNSGQGPSSINNTNSSNAPSPQSMTSSLLSSHSNNPTPTPQQQQQLQQQQHSLSSVVSAAALLQQLTPHHSNMSSTSHPNSGHSSPMPAHMNSNLMTDKLPFTSSNTVSQTNFTSINSTAMNFHQQGHNMQHTQNPFIVPLNENWRMPFSAGVDTQRFGSPTNASNSRNLGSRSDNFGGSLNQSGSQPLTDPRFHSFYSQNQ